MEEKNLATYKRILALAENVDVNFPELGRLLCDTQSEGGALFSSALKAVGKRTGYYLIEIDKALNPLGLDRARFVKIGWTKLSRLTKHITAENADMLLRIAEGHTDRQVIAIMRGKKPVAKARTVLLSLRPKHYKLFAKALTQHGAVTVGRGLAHQEKALMTIIKKVVKQ